MGVDTKLDYELFLINDVMIITLNYAMQAFHVMIMMFNSAMQALNVIIMMFNYAGPPLISQFRPPHPFVDSTARKVNLYL